MKRFFHGMDNPWNAFQSAFTEGPFEAFAMTRCQVSMLYRTTKDHLARHVDALTVRPTGSLWDYVPEPRSHNLQTLINDAQSPNVNVIDPADEVEWFAEEEDTRCRGCGKFMFRCAAWNMRAHALDDAYACANCRAAPFHLECLESHCDRCTARPEQADEEKEKAKEEETLQQEADDARIQWVNQMTKLQKIAMPLGCKITSVVVALISVALTVEPFWSPTAADAPIPLLQ